MRRYYADLLQSNTNYRRKIRNIHKKHQMLVASCTEIAKELCIEGYQESLPFFIAAISFPIDMRKILMKASRMKRGQDKSFIKGVEIIKHVEKAMLNFSEKTLKDYIDIPEISSLLLHYLSLVENRQYEEHYEFLREMAENRLKINEGSKESQSNTTASHVLNSLAAESLF